MTPRLTLYAWLLAPVALLAYHFGPGQAGLQRDEAARLMAIATEAEQKEDWPAALRAYKEALARIPAAETKLRNQVRLAHAKVRMYSGEIVEAMADLEVMLAEVSGDTAQKALGEEVRTTLGAAQYYIAWLMRLEGATAEEWTVQAENARQHFRLLSEESLKADPASAQEYQKSLEAVIRLVRMDTSELRGQPLPKFCCNCKDVSQKCRSQCDSRSKRPGDKPSDARKAGYSEPPRGGS